VGTYKQYIWAAIALIVAVALAYFLISISVSEGEPVPQSKFASDPPISRYEEHLLGLDREALDKAYKEHIGLVFGVWMKGPSDPESPRRAGVGARNARAGYEKSMDAIELREKQLRESKP
jgi:hypothetical protein